ncbi:MAG TPA: hypothetical protein VFB22_05855 [Candidatus Baltobacteraceae bacterium]|nr:hypothetical protein [Candidatus Baltobacteraceae bacterium]
MMSLPDDVLIDLIRRTQNLPDEKVPALLAYFRKLRERDPFYLDGILEDEGYLQSLSIPTIETTTLSCGLTGAFPFTDMRGKWEELLDAIGDLPPDAEIWTPLSNAFSRLTFDFLDGYDARFAYGIRQDGRLAAFRGFLRDIWKKIDGSPSAEAAERHARDFKDRLASEYATVTAEWSSIRRKYEGTLKKDALTYGFAGASGATISPSFSQGALAVAFSLALYLFRAREDARTLGAEAANFRAKFPLSIFIDVKGRV